MCVRASSPGLTCFSKSIFLSLCNYNFYTAFFPSPNSFQVLPTFPPTQVHFALAKQSKTKNPNKQTKTQQDKICQKQNKKKPKSSEKQSSSKQNTWNCSVLPATLECEDCPKVWALHQKCEHCHLSKSHMELLREQLPKMHTYMKEI